MSELDVLKDYGWSDELLETVRKLIEQQHTLPQFGQASTSAVVGPIGSPTLDVGYFGVRSDSGASFVVADTARMDSR